MAEKHAQCRSERLVDPGVASVAVAVLRGARSLRAVVEATGMPRMTAYSRLRRAARAGLVDWEPGLMHTLRPSVRVVASNLP